MYKEPNELRLVQIILVGDMDRELWGLDRDGGVWRYYDSHAAWFPLSMTKGVLDIDDR